MRFAIKLLLVALVLFLLPLAQVLAADIIRELRLRLEFCHQSGKCGRGCRRLPGRKRAQTPYS